jgi:hypothetical protein
VCTVEALRARGVEADIEVKEGARHLFDTFPETWVDFEPSVRRGYGWLASFVNVVSILIFARIETRAVATRRHQDMILYHYIGVMKR